VRFGTQSQYISFWSGLILEMYSSKEVNSPLFSIVIHPHGVGREKGVSNKSNLLQGQTTLLGEAFQALLSI